MREARRKPGFSLLECIHGYIYARWPYLYIAIGTGEHRSIRLAKPLINLALRILAHHPADKPKVELSGLTPTRTIEDKDSGRVTFADTYHGKVILLDAAKKLVSVDKEIHLSPLEKVIPYTMARDLILKNPDHILLLDCPCRVARPNPCLPLDVCLIVGEPFAGFAAEHYPEHTRWITRAEAIDVLRSADERGHMHHAFFKEALLGRFYAICNCCACCCGAIQAHRNGVPMLASSGYLNKIDADRCAGCETCVRSCPFEAISMKDGIAVVNAALCMGCGICVPRCSAEALSLVRDPTKGEPLEVDELMSASAGSSRICSVK